MTLLIILFTVAFLGFFLAKKLDDGWNDWDLWGRLIGVVSLFLAIVQSLLLVTASYRYGYFKAKRDAFEITLIEARKSGNAYETMAITKNVASWNASLAAVKYENTLWFTGQYIDDRVEKLNPIK